MKLSDDDIHEIFEVANRAVAMDRAKRKPPDVVDTAEIARRLGVAKDTVHRWRQRFDDFPEPNFNLDVGPVWLWPNVELWAKRTGRLEP